MRRYLLIAGISLGVILLGAVIYFSFFAPQGEITVTPGVPGGLPAAGNQTITPSGDEVLSGGEPEAVSARLVKISAGPIVPGVAVVNQGVRTASSTPDVSIRFIERRSGNVFSYLAKARTLTRTSNRTVPGIQSAAWLPDGSTAFVRYLSGTDSQTVNTYALPANGGSGFFLPQDLSDIAVSSTSLLTLVSGVNGSTVSTRRTDGSRATEVFATVLSSLHVSFAGKTKYLAYPKPSAELPGAAFLVDGSGRFSRIAGPRTGLSALASPSGKWVLVTYAEENSLQMELIDTATGNATVLPVATVAEKCAWTANEATVYCGIPTEIPPSYRYPDDWYQGAVSFSDRLWKIEIAGRYAQLVLDFPQETDAELDAQTLALDPEATTLVFVNKRDGSLWGYSL